MVQAYDTFALLNGKLVLILSYGNNVSLVRFCGKLSNPEFNVLTSSLSLI